jgi:hypothetical protein
MSVYEIYNRHLEHQLSEGSPFVEKAVYDPEGAAVDMSGIFDDTTRRSNKDAGNVTQYQAVCRFLVYDFDSLGIEIYNDKKIFLSERNITYTIEFADRDANGVQVIWLR